MQGWIDLLRSFDVTLFTAGGTPVTAWTVIGLLLSLLLLFAVARWLRYWLLARLLARTPLDHGTRQTVATLVYYMFVVTGLAVVMQNAGIKLSAFTLLAGAVGVGIGFGLQNIVSNFVSGLIVMFERPVKIGDRIDIGGIEGDVVSIAARSTVLRTNRGAAAIIPNQRLITEYVRNWAAEHGATTLQIPLKVAREQDMEAVRALLLDAVHALAAAPTAAELLAERAPAVYCTALDAASVSFELQVWTRGTPMQRAGLQTELLLRIQRLLPERGVRLV